MALRDADRKILTKLLGWLDPSLVRPPERKPPLDTLEDIKGIPIDYFWRKCEEHLPSDWGMMLAAGLGEDGRMLYRAEAALGTDDEYRPSLKTRLRDTPERALEELFYALRDML